MDYRDEQFARSRTWASKEEFEADYISHMEDKYGSVWVSLFMFLIKIAINALWNKYHAN